MPKSMQTGLCVTGGCSPDLWNCGPYDHAARAEAISICQRCPALADCADWSLFLPATEKYAIYGGMTAKERARRRHERAQAAGPAS